MENGTERRQVPDKKEAQKFWGSIWGERIDAKWPEKFK